MRKSSGVQPGTLLVSAGTAKKESTIKSTSLLFYWPFRPLIVFEHIGRSKPSNDIKLAGQILEH